MDGWWTDVDPDHMWNPSEQDEEHPPFHQAQEADHRWRISRERHRLVVQVLRICGETGSRDGWVWFYLLWLWLLNRDEDAWTVFVFQVKQKDGSPFPHLFEKSKNSSCTMLFIKVFKWKINLPMELNCRLKYSHSERQLTSSNFKSMFGILLWSRRCSLIFSCCMIRTLSSLQTPDWLISVYGVSLNRLKFWPTLETGNHKQKMCLFHLKKQSETKCSELDFLRDTLQAETRSECVSSELVLQEVRPHLLTWHTHTVVHCSFNVPGLAQRWNKVSG